ncbi:PREDICTED: large proline-rich protein BAG6-like isoform X2 [Populus euphratica]|uniref:Large proline-rich protein BAG6-like isoform X2 n=1 Tax=Populus euphratica TaxID=75702 RepID=A0AAJ6Y401_POPEU|nr:PREDICTED: large proline-rich protein BAG6-like isoform X2 [Populus euphratica]
MANEYSNEGSSTSHVSGEGSDATLEITIKTLNSQKFSFQVNKNMPVSVFKEKIANEIGVPVSQQRLIFRGRVLKDEHLLSEYQVENGHTLHLVARQPAQPQPSADTSSGDTTRNNGNNASAGAPRNRIGPISHSIVLGTFNVGDQGGGIVPDLNQAIGAVLNSFGIGGQAATNSIGGMLLSNMPNVTGQASQGSETGVSRGNIGGQSPAGNQTQFGQPFQSAPQVVQVPLTGAIPVPSLHLPIPDSLNTLLEFITHMERVLAQNGNLPNTSAASIGDPPTVELPSNARGLPTPEALSIVLHRAEQLLSGPTTAALSHIAGRLEQLVSSTDPAIRGQIQSESMQVGLAMQHLGSLLLELGRTILTLNMGQSPAESSVNAGPAVYISPSGPNPIMVQPFPLQTNSLFGGSVPPSNPVAFGPVGIGNAPRHVNIHIHAGTSLASVIPAIGNRTSSTGVQGEHGNTASSGVSGPEQVLPVRNVVVATVPLRSAGVTVAAQPGLGLSLSQPPSDSMSLSSIVNEINSQVRQLSGNMQEENQPASGSIGSDAGNNPTNSEMNSTVFNGVGESSVSLPGVMSEHHGQKVQVHDNDPFSSKGVPSSSVDRSSSLKSDDTSQDVSSSSSKHDVPDNTKAVPLGLGLGSLDRKRLTKQPKSLVGSVDSETTNTHPNQNPDSGIIGQQLLQSLAFHSSCTDRNITPSDPVAPSAGQVMEGRPPINLSSDGQLDTASVVSQVLHSPVINNLLTGVSEQTGVGSPNVFRNMLQQLTQNPQIMNTVSQIAQQVDSQDFGNMFSGLGSGQGGGIDLSGMVRQMMPVVSQVLVSGSPTPQLFPTPEPEPQMQSSEGESNGAENPNIQINLHEVAQRIERFDAPQDVFQAIVGNAVRLNGNGSNAEDILHELNNNEDLASDYLEMLQCDIHRRLQDDSGEEKS